MAATKQVVSLWNPFIPLFSRFQLTRIKVPLLSRDGHARAQAALACLATGRSSIGRFTSADTTESPTAMIQTIR